jgi:dethiobiotin synthetase
LRAAAGFKGTLDEVCPYRFTLPAAPLVAATAASASISVERIEALAAKGSPVVVEAAGGLLVPVAREVAAGSLEQADPAERPPAQALVTNLDLAERLGLPVVLVGRAGLGTLNHCALSAEALARRGIEIAAIVLNRVQAEDDATVSTNRRLVEEMSGCTVLGPTPYVADSAARPAALLSSLASLVDTPRRGR